MENRPISARNEITAIAKDMEKKTVLVVYDNAASRALMSLVLTRSGYAVVEASTVSEALEKARSTQPDLIIIDISR